MMKNAIRACAVFGLVAAQLAAAPALCAIPRSLQTRSWFFGPKLFDFSKGINFGLITPIQSNRTTNVEDVARVIPTNMAPTSDTGQVASQVLEHSLSSFFNSAHFRRSELGRTAAEAEKQMEGNVALGGDEPESIKHQLKFAMRATQTRALVEYSGLTNAQLSYQIATERLDLELRESISPLGLGTQVVYNHISSRDVQADIVSLRWIW